MLAYANNDINIENELLSIDGVGPVTIKELKFFFTDQHIFKQLEEIIKEVKVFDVEIESNNHSLSGKNIVFTGTITISRSEAKAQAEKVGVKVTSTVSSKTDYVILGENPGSKLKEAQKLNVKIISETEWQNLVNQIY